MQEGKKPQRPVQGAPLPALQRPNAFQPDRMPAGGERSEGVEEGTVVVRETAGPPPRAPATFSHPQCRRASHLFAWATFNMCVASLLEVREVLQEEVVLEALVRYT